MKRHAKALNAYQDVNVSSAVPYADGVQLIQMLFDGLIDSLSAAEGHLVRKSIKEKSDALYRASNICLLYTSPSPRDVEESRMPSSA